MADVVGPQVEDSNSTQADENYKLYKRRWLVLTAMFSISLVVGLHRSIISIADWLDVYMQMTTENYVLMCQVSIFTMMLSVFPVARGLEYFGLRRMAYFACAMILCANFFKTLSCDDTYVGDWIKSHRYQFLILSEAFVGLANSVALCVPPKVASAWFANYENTLALVIAFCGFNIGVSFSNYFTPIFVTSPEDIHKLCYMFIISGIFVIFIVLTCITRSSPKIPPSVNALLAANTSVPLKSGISVMLKHPHYVLLLLTLTFNMSILSIEQMTLEDILSTQKYSDSFCGTLIAHSYFFGTFFMLMGAAWLDNSTNYIKVSKISSIVCALCIVSFNISIAIPNIKSIIIVTNLLASFGCSLMYPALLQVAIRCAVGILPEASVSAVVIITQQILSAVLLNLLTPLRKITPVSNYASPLIFFSILVLSINILYLSVFKPPMKEDLQSRLANQESEVLVNEED